MDLIYKGKTKDVYKLDNQRVRLFFKDDMTGKDGKFDPGENQVDLTVDGAGQANLDLTTYFFKAIKSAGYPTHFIQADLDQASMDVKEAEVFGKGLEFICRFKATGSFIRRYGDYIEDGSDLDAYAEVSLKSDDRNDPFITKDGLVQLGILTSEEYEELMTLTKDISTLIRDILKDSGMDLYDIKLEFGRDKETGQVMLIDEVSGGNMRVYKDGTYVFPLDINQYVLNK